MGAFGGVDFSNIGNSFVDSSQSLVPFIPPSTTLDFTAAGSPDSSTTTPGSPSTIASILQSIAAIGNVAVGGILAARMPATSIKQPSTIVTPTISSTTPQIPGTITVGGVTANKNLLYIAIILLVIAGVLWASKKM